MCGGAFNAACADCADALVATAITRAAANAASFALDISLLSFLNSRTRFGWAHSRTVQPERRASGPNVNGPREQAELAVFIRFGKRSQVHVRRAVHLRLVDRNYHRRYEEDAGQHVGLELLPHVGRFCTAAAEESHPEV